MLRLAAEILVNIHGQNESLSLANAGYRRSVLDAYANDKKELSEYEAYYKRLTELRSKYKSMQAEDKERKYRRRDDEEALKELTAAKLKGDEVEGLEEERKELTANAAINKQAGFADRALYGHEQASAKILTEKSAAALESLSQTIPELGQAAERLYNIADELRDIAEAARDNIKELGGDPEFILDRIESRLELISKLSVKYNMDEKGLFEYKQKLDEELSDYDIFAEKLADLEDELKIAEKQTEIAAQTLSEKRKTAGKLLSDAVNASLAYLDMPKAIFAVSVTRRYSGNLPEYFPGGGDDIEFMISTAPGEPQKPLSDTASGGELSRIMLALKSALAGADIVGTLIYDEIDAGVSGSTARKIGIKLKDSSINGQVICVTHSAQIASLADCHLLVAKEEVDGRFETSIKELDSEGRINEISRILGGINITDAQRRAAYDMIYEA
jgi:DNA repair protein RecN (Recombination protein N)